MGLIYSRTIDVHRPKTQAVAGTANVATLVGYTGTTIDTTSLTGETIIYSQIPASIQFKSPLSRGESTLPSDTHAPGAWEVFISASYAAKGTIINRDVLVDDLSNRYQVEDSYWTAFGYNLRARLLEL